jgi:hypothetical protein
VEREMRLKKQILLLILLITCDQHVPGSQINVSTVREKESLKKKSSTKPVKPGKQSGNRVLTNANKVQLFRQMADKIFLFEDVTLRVRTAIPVAELLCHEYGEKEYSREIYEKAFNSSQNIDAENQENKRKNKQTAISLQNHIITSVKRCDSDFAQKLSARVTRGGKGSERAKTPEHILDERLAAQEQQEITSAKNAYAKGIFGIDDKNKLNMSSFLVSLDVMRRTNQDLANELFFDALSKLLTEPSSTVKDLMMMGNYFFFPFPGMKRPTVSFSEIKVGNAIVNRITTNKVPNADDLSIVKYLDLAAMFLARQSKESNEKKSASAAAFMFIPLAEKFHPDLIPFLITIRDDSNSGFVDPSNYVEKTLDEKLKEIEKIAGSVERDARYMALIDYECRAKNFKTARQILEKVSDMKASRQVAAIVTFIEATEKLDNNSFREIEEIIKKLDGRLKAILSLKVGEEFLKKGNKQLSSHYLDLALTSFGSDIESFRHFQLLPNIVLLKNQISTEMGIQALNEAISIFNSVGNNFDSLTSYELGRIDYEKIELQNRSVYFRLPGDLIRPVSLRMAIAPLARADLSGTLYSVMLLKNERLLSVSILALLSNLNTEKSPKAKAA